MSQLIIYIISLMAAQTQPAPENPLEVFPSITAETLSGKTIQLPEHLSGTRSLVVVAFQRQAQGVVDSWRKPFMRDYANQEAFRFMEVPMIHTGWKWMRGMIDSGMQQGVPASLHDHVATYYGPLQGYIRQMGIKDKSTAHIFLLDEQGHILWQGKGRARAASYEAMERHLLNDD